MRSMAYQFIRGHAVIDKSLPYTHIGENNHLFLIILSLGVMLREFKKYQSLEDTQIEIVTK